MSQQGIGLRTVYREDVDFGISGTISGPSGTALADHAEGSIALFHLPAAEHRSGRGCERQGRACRLIRDVEYVDDSFLFRSCVQLGRIDVRVTPM